MESYAGLLDSATQVAQDHELLIAIQVDERRAWRAAGADARHAGARPRGAGVRGAGCASSRRSPVGSNPATLAVLGLLDAEQLTAADPARLRSLPPAHRSAPRRSGRPPRTPHWSTYRADGALHRTYWVAEWPRTEVGPAFFTPLLLGLQAVRAVSVVFDPVPPTRARAAVEAAITSDEADEQVRTERGFRITARRRRQSDSARQREQELADGHEEMRFAGLRHRERPRRGRARGTPAPSSSTPPSVRFSCLEPLWGQQDLGLCFAALPLARGLKPAKPWSVSS